MYISRIETCLCIFTDHNLCMFFFLFLVNFACVPSSIPEKISISLCSPSLSVCKDCGSSADDGVPHENEEKTLDPFAGDSKFEYQSDHRFGHV